MQNSMNNHLSRRTVQIRYWCAVCAASTLFFNRCALLSHLRSHNLTIAALDRTCITISELSKEMIDAGIISTNFKRDIISALPLNETILRKDIVPKKIIRNGKFVTVNNLKPNQSFKNVKKPSILLPKPNILKDQPIVPNPVPSSVQTPLFRIKDQSLILGNKITPKVVTVLYNSKQPSSPNTNLTTLANVIPPNIVCEAISHNTKLSAPINVIPSNVMCKGTSQNSKQGTPTNIILPNVMCVATSQNSKLSAPINVIPSNIICKTTSQNNKMRSSVNVIPPNVMCEATTSLNAKLSSLMNVIPSNLVYNATSQNTNGIPPNVMCEVTTTNTTDDMIIDNDFEEVPNTTNEEEEIDIESVTVENWEKDKSTINKAKNKKSTSNTLKSLRKSCAECGANCINISKHLNGNNHPSDPSLACQKCQLILPTKCALEIHLRNHKKLAPHKCPDCGKDFLLWEDAYAHLKFSCGHFAKCVRFMCASCNSHFPSRTRLGQHIISDHARDVFKCVGCNVAYTHKPSLKSHMLEKHSGDYSFALNCNECFLCEKLFAESEFLEHVEVEHLRNNQCMIYGYKCPVCGVVYANKMAFIIHQIEEKTVADKINKKPTPLKAKSMRHITNEHVQEQEVVFQASNQSQNCDSDVEEEPEIVRKYPDMTNYSSVAEKDPLSLDDCEFNQEQEVTEERSELCIICKKNVVILLPGIDLNVQSRCCKKCVKPLDNKSLTVKNNHKARKDAKCSLSSQRTSENPIIKSTKHKLPLVNERSLSCGEAKAPQKKRRSTEILETDFTQIKKKSKKKSHKGILDPITRSQVQGEVCSKSPNDMVCSYCSFLADSKKTFLEHIKVHRTEPNSYQCLECGLCFVTDPTLQRHLQIYHGIKDVNEYTDKNMVSLPEELMQVEITPQVEENQCRVCYELFDCSSSLEKHFRSHGMAFMSTLTKSP